jgi:hypothetical protein
MLAQLTFHTELEKKIHVEEKIIFKRKTVNTSCKSGGISS